MVLSCWQVINAYGLGELGVIGSKKESAPGKLVICIKLMRKQVLYVRALTLLKDIWLEDNILVGTHV